MARIVSAEVAVIGAGFAGLSAACHLRRLQHDVVVFERDSTPGGWAGALTDGGYRFDTGPTVITMPQLVDDAFRAVGSDTGSHVELHRLDTAYRAHFDDGSTVAVTSTVAGTRAEIERLAGPRGAEGFDDFVAWVGDLYRLEFDSFIDRDLDGIVDLLRQWRTLARLAADRGFRTWWSQVERCFDDQRLQRLFSFQAMYAGVSPLEALALFAIIAHMDTVEGVYAARGGVQAVGLGLATAAEQAGVEFVYDTAVERVTTNADGPVLTLASGEEHRFAAVVATPDLPITYTGVLGTREPRRVQHGRFSPSCVVWFVKATGALPAGAAHHNVHFGRAWETAFAELGGGQVMDDPSRFVTIGSISDPTAAPEGSHTLFVLEPVPNLNADLNWAELTPRLTDRMLQWADDAGYPVSCGEVVGSTDPMDWRARGASRGTPFSLAHRFTQSGPFRPAPHDRRFPRVVFAGAGTRPGVGIPMVLISGRIAAQRASKMVS